VWEGKKKSYLGLLFHREESHPSNPRKEASKERIGSLATGENPGQQIIVD